jgi:hypothetical protein
MPYVDFPSAPVAPPAPLPARSRSYRMRHDCLFIPNMDVALQFLDARRRANAEPARTSAVPPRPVSMESAVAIGLLMTIAPPIAVTMLWASPQFSRTAQIALTCYGALVTLVMAAIAIVAIV